MTSLQPVLVIIGCGGMGLAIAKRLSSGHQVLLADASSATLKSAVEALQGDDHAPESCNVNVRKFDSVSTVAQKAASMGRIDAIVHTAGVSPMHGTCQLMYEVDLLGTANVIEAFFPVLSPGTSLVCTASIVGHQPKLSPEFESHLATAPLDKLLQHPELDFEANSGVAYTVSKRANLLRIQAASVQWRTKSARINSVSPGVIATPMSKAELEGPLGPHLVALNKLSISGRMGSTEDIANAVAFLTSREASFITGTDLLVDGGVLGGQLWGQGG
ncbi:hypothetical protein AJ79_05400 [Helicocarpus griseus UAMH5409]|uniref:Uncharacterized protein n=1 Tax=Helicocarpus griseus UAMH5409 TaxID=1447875 RepID=A0A2B7XPM6_9EURO|nr:hypothetical protein AJ79_05400 [Helicocarpus griseus UAMH5409]